MVSAIFFDYRAFKKKLFVIQVTILERNNEIHTAWKKHFERWSPQCFQIRNLVTCRRQRIIRGIRQFSMVSKSEHWWHLRSHKPSPGTSILAQAWYWFGNRVPGFAGEVSTGSQTSKTQENFQNIAHSSQLWAVNPPAKPVNPRVVNTMTFTKFLPDFPLSVPINVIQNGA